MPGMPHLVAGLLAASLVWACIRLRRRPEMLLLILWVVMPVLATARQQVIPHYLTVTYPAQFILIGAMLDDLARLAAGRAPRRWRRLPGAGASFLIAAVAVTELLFFSSFLLFLRDHGGAHGDYGMAFRHKRQVAQFIAGDVGERAYRFRDLTAEQADPETVHYLMQLYGGRGKLISHGRGRDRSGRAEKTYILISDDFPVEVGAFPSALRLLNRFRFGSFELLAFEAAAGPAQEGTSQRATGARRKCKAVRLIRGAGTG